VDPGAAIFLELTDHAILYFTPSAITLKWNPTLYVCVRACARVIRVFTVVKI